MPRRNFGARVRVGQVWENNRTRHRFIVRNIYRKDKQVLIAWLPTINDPLEPLVVETRPFQYLREYCRLAVWNREEVE